MELSEIPRGVRFPRPPSGARVRAPPPPGAPCGLYYVFQWFLRNPVGAPARPAERRGPRQAPSRAAVAAGKPLGTINRLSCPSLFASISYGFRCLPAGRPGARGLRRPSGDSAEPIGISTPFHDPRWAAQVHAAAGMGTEGVHRLLLRLREFMICKLF